MGCIESTNNQVTPIHTIYTTHTIHTNHGTNNTNTITPINNSTATSTPQQTYTLK